MRLKKAALKGIIWELIGIVSFVIWTGDWAFSLAWAAYRTVTFPIFEFCFKRIVRWWYSSLWPQPGTPSNETE